MGLTFGKEDSIRKIRNATGGLGGSGAGCLDDGPEKNGGRGGTGDFPDFEMPLLIVWERKTPAYPVRQLARRCIAPRRSSMSSWCMDRCGHIAQLTVLKRIAATCSPEFLAVAGRWARLWTVTAERAGR